MSATLNRKNKAISSDIGDLVSSNPSQGHTCQKMKEDLLSVSCETQPINSVQNDKISTTLSDLSFNEDDFTQEFWNERYRDYCQLAELKGWDLSWGKPTYVCTDKDSIDRANKVAARLREEAITRHEAFNRLRMVCKTSACSPECETVTA